MSGFLDYRIANGHCGRCLGDRFQEGPHGGLSINVRCVTCGQTYWTGPPSLGASGSTEQDADLFHGDPRTLQEIFAEAQRRHE